MKHIPIYFVKTICCCFVALLVWGCNALKSEVPLKDLNLLPKQDKRYQILSSISPDREVQEVYIQLLGDLEHRDNKVLPVTNATVSIKRKSDGVTFPLTLKTVEYLPNFGIYTEYLPNFGIYTVGKDRFSPVVGEKYELNVEIDGETFTGETEIPIDYFGEFTIKSARDQKVGSYTSFQTDERVALFDRILFIEFKDIPNGKDNYYYIVARSHSSYKDSTPEFPTGGFVRIMDRTNGGSLNTYNNLGGTKQVLAYYAIHDDAYKQNRLDSVVFTLFVTDRNFHDYHRVLPDYNGSENSILAAEPVVIPSNINNVNRKSKKAGAQGVFGSYNAKRLVFTTEEIAAKVRK